MYSRIENGKHCYRCCLAASRKTFTPINQKKTPVYARYIGNEVVYVDDLESFLDGLLDGGGGGISRAGMHQEVYPRVNGRATSLE